MTQYNTLNVELSNSQLNKLKSAIKNGFQVIFHQILSVMMRLICHINYYQLIHKFQKFQMPQQLIQNFQKINC